MKTLSVTLIGLGPRGLCVLERILSLAARRPESQVRIVIVNKGLPGQGVHKQTLSDRSLLNTVAGLLTLIPGDGFQPSLVKGLFADFLPWLHKRGVAADGGTYVPRRLFGAYSHELYQLLMEHCPTNCHVEYIDDEAIDVQQSGQKEVTCLLSHRRIFSDYVVIAVGHMLPVAKRGDMIIDIYSGELTSQTIPAGSTVGIQGFGLTAMDAIAELTRGRGGVFVSGRYHAAGTEPFIVLFSRSGLPSRARPSDDGCAGFMPRLQFDKQTALALRRRRTPGTINFLTDVYPLLAQDVARTALGREMPSLAAIAVLDHLLWPEITQGNSQEYAAGVIEFVKRDLREAHSGLSGSAEKRALEVLMCAREAIRVVVNHGGLTPSSHRWFYNHFASAINRNAIGPQHDRQHELLMLIDAGIVSTPVGPAPELKWMAQKHCWNLRSTVFASPVSIDLDHLLQGYSAQPTLKSTTSALLSALAESGRVYGRHANWLALPGVAVDAHSRCVSASGAAQPRLFVTGVMSEGSTYYNWYVPTITGRSTPFVEAQRIACAVLADIGGRDEVGRA